MTDSSESSSEPLGGASDVDRRVLDLTTSSVRGAFETRWGRYKAAEDDEGVLEPSIAASNSWSPNKWAVLPIRKATCWPEKDCRKSASVKTARHQASVSKSGTAISHHMTTEPLQSVQRRGSNYLARELKSLDALHIYVQYIRVYTCVYYIFVGALV